MGPSSGNEILVVRTQRASIGEDSMIQTARNSILIGRRPFFLLPWDLWINRIDSLANGSGTQGDRVGNRGITDEESATGHSIGWMRLGGASIETRSPEMWRELPEGWNLFPLVWTADTSVRCYIYESGNDVAIEKAAD